MKPYRAALCVALACLLGPLLAGCGALEKDTTATVMNAPCRQYCEASCGVGPPYYAGCGTEYDAYYGGTCAKCSCFKLAWTLPDWVSKIDDSWCYAFVPSSE